MKSKDLQPRLFYPMKLSFRMEGQIKNIVDKKKLKEFITTKPVLQGMLKDLLEEGGEEGREKKKKKKKEKEGGEEGGGEEGERRRRNE